MAESRPDVVLYTRAGCHLCEDAMALLGTFGITPEVIDIDHDTAIREKYHECVPVVKIDGKVRFRGQIEPMLLRRLLRRPSR